VAREQGHSDAAIRKLIESERQFLTERLSQNLSPTDREIFTRQLRGYDQMEALLDAPSRVSS
jgi:hypothetical protein